MSADFFQEAIIEVASGHNLEALQAEIEAEKRPDGTSLVGVPEVDSVHRLLTLRGEQPYPFKMANRLVQSGVARRSRERLVDK